MDRIEEYSQDTLSTIAGNIVGGIINSENVSTLLVEDDFLKNPISDCLKDMQCVNESLNSDFGSKSEINIKKLIAGAAVLAKHTNVLPIPKESMSPVAIAAAVDEGLSQLKVAHKVDVGELDAEDAVDKLVDFAVARTAEAIDNAVPRIKEIADVTVEEYTPKVINLVCSAVEKMYPPATTVTTVVRGLTPYITKVTKTGVRNGIEKLASIAKKTLVKVAPKIKNFGTKLLQKLFGYGHKGYSQTYTV